MVTSKGPFLLDRQGEHRDRGTDWNNALKGDVSLAPAAHNAVSRRVKEDKGITPFGETLRFRNRTLEFYREYIKKLKDQKRPELLALRRFGLLRCFGRAMLKLLCPPDPYFLAVLKFIEDSVKLLGEFQVEYFAPREKKKLSFKTLVVRHSRINSLAIFLKVEVHLLDSLLEIEYFIPGLLDLF